MTTEQNLTENCEKSESPTTIAEQILDQTDYAFSPYGRCYTD